MLVVPSTRKKLSAFLSVCLFLATGLVGCSESKPEIPARAVQLSEGLLSMSIDADWEFEDETEDGRVYLHRDHEDLRLHIEPLVDDLGLDLQVRMVKTMIGKELNLEYGGVWDRISMNGLAMLRYSVETLDEYDDPVHNERWVLAKPTGQGDITRVDFNVAVPRAISKHPAIPKIIDRLDVQVGDARIPRV